MRRLLELVVFAAVAVSMLQRPGLCDARPSPSSHMKTARRPLIQRIQKSVSASSSMASTTASGPIPRFTPGKIRRTLQSWMIRQNTYERNARRMGRLQAQRSSQARRWTTASELIARNGKRHGSFLTFSKPSRDRVWEWFGVKNIDENDSLQSLLSRQKEQLFNHQSVGMTNPVIHVSEESTTQSRRTSLPTKGDRVVPANIHGKSCEQQDSSKCWPSTAIPTITKTTTSPKTLRRREMFANAVPYLAVRRDEWQQLKETSDSWRVLVWRATVGTGRECYEKVRDAALDWEFTSADGSMGVMQIPTSPPRGTVRHDQSPSKRKTGGSSSSLPKPYVPSVSSRYSIRPVDMPITSSDESSSSFHRSLGSASRRLVTFTSSLRHKIYNVNPVMVLYDVVDQRAPGSLYTATSYGTMKGHWLSGEERVIVRWCDRDGHGQGQVDVEILSASRAGPSFVGKVLWRFPFLQRKQKAFFEEQLKYLQKVAESTEEGKLSVEQKIVW
mmetsp:Transcript_29286/g.70570  ORF Transcript_29286/g.70570 Transcript_29286/m.70570 type:complete len:500 (-) Transcript_29286:2283-3782(-)